METDSSAASSDLRASSWACKQVSDFGYWEGELFVAPDTGHFLMTTRLYQQVDLLDRFGEGIFLSTR